MHDPNRVKSVGEVRFSGARKRRNNRHHNNNNKQFVSLKLT